MKVGLVPISGKPFHVGHEGLVEIAARDCDRVVVFLSVSDRGGDGELLIKGSDMYRIYKEYVEPAIVSIGNVEVEYCGPGMPQPSPVRAVYRFLEREEAEMREDYYVIYSGVDPSTPGGDDTSKYKPAVLAKSAPRLYGKGPNEGGHISIEGVTRGVQTVAASGTQMRQLLTAGDFQNFSKLLPTRLSSEAKKNIFDILRGEEDKLEEAIRLAVRKLLGEAKLREVEITGGEKVKHGSKKHVGDLKRRIAELESWRTKERRGSERRANYSRIIGLLKRELRTLEKQD